jgi:hypothetical protein
VRLRDHLVATDEHGTDRDIAVLERDKALLEGEADERFVPVPACIHGP